MAKLQLYRAGVVVVTFLCTVRKREADIKLRAHGLTALRWAVVNRRQLAVVKVPRGKEEYWEGKIKERLSELHFVSLDYRF